MSEKISLDSSDIIYIFFKMDNLLQSEKQNHG